MYNMLVMLYYTIEVIDSCVLSRLYSIAYTTLHSYCAMR